MRRFTAKSLVLVAALATLKGPRHGGANEDVLAMLREIGDPEAAEAFVAARLAGRERLSRAERAAPRARVPGFGHRVYRVDDARARVLANWERVGQMRREFPEFAINWQAVFREPGTAGDNKRVMGLHPDAPLTGRVLRELRTPGLE